jgi:hypothetical protein
MVCFEGSKPAVCENGNVSGFPSFKFVPPRKSAEIISREKQTFLENLSEKAS